MKKIAALLVQSERHLAVSGSPSWRTGITALLIPLLFLLLQPVSAQEYLPVLNPDAEWSALHLLDNGLFNPRDIITEHYRLGGDTLIDQIAWKKIYLSTDSTFSWDDPNLQFGGLIREEEGRVYYAGDLIKYHEDGDLIYDFNLEEGDIFWEGSGDTSTPIHLIVHQIDTVFLQDGIPRRRYRLRFYFPIPDVTSDLDHCVWVEGLGDIENGLLHHYLPADYGLDLRLRDELICFKINENIIYDSPDYEGCFFEKFVVNTMETSLPRFEVFPNPGSDVFYLSSSGHVKIDRLIIYDQRGCLIYQASDITLAGDHQIDASAWLAGSYILQLEIKDRQQSIKLLRF